MTTVTGPATPRLPHGVLASTVIGIASGACGWLLNGILPALTVSYIRLDQLAALVVGGVVGASVIASRAFRQRGDPVFSAVAGALLGGVGALAGASLLAFAHSAVSPRIFLIERMGAWALACGGATVFLALFANARAARWIAESMLISAGGGAIAGVIFTLPGASDVWQAVACLWFGGTVGFAVAGPELWHAVATVEHLPPRGAAASLLTIRESPIHEGNVVALGEAQLACLDGRIALYPPAGGVVAGGRNVRHAAFVTASGTIVAGRARYHLQVQRAP
jgi:hypothetical protein